MNGFAIAEGLRALRVNWTATMATLTTMLVSLSIGGAFVLLGVNLGAFAQDLTADVRISVLLQDGVDAQRLKGEMSQWPGVAVVKFISRDQALADVAQSFGLPELGAALPENPLKDILELSVSEPRLAAQVASRARRLSESFQVIFGEEAAAQLGRLSAGLRLGAWVLIGILMLNSLFATVNTIRVAVLARRTEIEVMRLVGATDSFIRTPFLMGGMALGALAGLLAAALVLGLYLVTIVRFQSTLSFVRLVHDPLQLALVVALTLFPGVVLGLLGSALAVRQHLRG